MIAELGQLAAIVALCLAVLQSGFALVGVARRQVVWMAAAIPLAISQFVFLIVALLLLAWLFVLHDFSVEYVANNSNTLLPLVYRLAAVWGGHEGSLLLWICMLAGWAAAVAVLSKNMPLPMRARLLGVLGLLSSGFLFFMVAASSPFARLSPAAVEGRDLNPLLQDPGLIIHPPMLYMGYVGFSVAFAFAIAALLSGRMDSAWAKWLRPWAQMAWVFLTCGIVLGSWWAYYELGWGGWWFWDPVENASFMPWLAGTALLHSLACVESRGAFKSWTALLAILTFSLCLLGTFLVRSGILISVHAFATSPERGLFILILLSITVGGSLLLYGWRATKLEGGSGFALWSRESGILLNNIFLTTAAFSVLLGTLYPLILDSLGVGKISVGPPYFNAVFAPLAAIPAMLLGVGALLRWKRDMPMRLIKLLSPALVLSITAGVSLPLLMEGEVQWIAMPGLALGFWVLSATVTALFMRWKNNLNIDSSFLGMLSAHAGIGIFVIGVTMTGVYSYEKDVRLAIGEPVDAGGYVFTLKNIGEYTGENYEATIAEVAVDKNGEEAAVLRPEKRYYASAPKNPLTEAGIHARWNGDLYASLGEALGDGAWSARVQIKPFVRFIWGGAMMMALGGVLAAFARRRKIIRPNNTTKQQGIQ